MSCSSDHGPFPQATFAIEAVSQPSRWSETFGRSIDWPGGIPCRSTARLERIFVTTEEKRPKLGLAMAAAFSLTAWVGLTALIT